MTNDLYMRMVLTVIAGALVYLCLVLTPLPALSAQVGQVVGAPTPGVSTGPGEMVIVGWRVPDTIPVTVARGEVRLTNDTVRVNGRVETEQAPNTASRTTLIGWEDGAARPQTSGIFRGFTDPKTPGLPVVVRPQSP
jgi:hypothetical protein